MTVALAVLVTLPETKLLVQVVDLFAPKEPTKSSHRKRPYLDDDPNAIHFHIGLTEKEELELVLRESRQKAETRRAHKLEQVRGVVPFEHSTITKEATTQV